MSREQSVHEWPISLGTQMRKIEAKAAHLLNWNLLLSCLSLSFRLSCIHCNTHQVHGCHIVLDVLSTGKLHDARIMHAACSMTLFQLQYSRKVFYVYMCNAYAVQSQWMGRPSEVQR